VAVTAGVAALAAGAPVPTRDGAAGVMPSLEDRLLGTLVHRMLQRIDAAPPDASVDAGALARAARALLADEEIAALDDPSSAVAHAAATFAAIAAREDLRALLQSGDRLHEVPFSLQREGRVLRGTIDCLVLRGGEGGQPSAVTVVEFKTGRKRVEHQQQIDIYVDAARALFPGAAVDGLLVYPA
jgi:ATP-dependent exoDNAse (exonuclease V) beta subunit